MRVYITKYALTAGIEVAEVKAGAADPKYVYTKMGLGFRQFVMGETAFLTYTEAATAACAMRDKKEASLRKQLSKMYGLVFPMREPDDLKEL